MSEQKPLWPAPVKVIGASGEVGTGKTIFGLSITDPAETLVIDEEGSASIYAKALGFKHVNLPDEVMQSKKSLKPIDAFQWWRDYINNRIPANTYRVIMHDIFSLVDAGITDWVEQNPSFFGHTSQQYSKASGIKWGDVKELYRVLLLEIGTKCETFYFTTHMGAEFKDGSPSGKRRPKGKETFMQLADLYLIFDRKPSKDGNYPNAGKPGAIVAKSRLYSALTFNRTTGELESTPALPPRLPIATPNEIRRYMLTPVDLRNLKPEERVEEERLTDAQRLELETAKAQAEASAEGSRLERTLKQQEIDERKAAIRARMNGTTATMGATATTGASAVATVGEGEGRTQPTAGIAQQPTASADPPLPTVETPEAKAAAPRDSIEEPAKPVDKITPAATAKPADKSSSTPAASVTEPTPAQLGRIIALKRSMFAAKSLVSPKDDAEIKSAWDMELKPFGVTTAKQMPPRMAEKFIEVLEAKYDFPPSGINTPAKGPMNGIDHAAVATAEREAANAALGFSNPSATGKTADGIPY